MKAGVAADWLAGLLVVASLAPAQQFARIPASTRTIQDGETGVRIEIATAEFLMGRTEVTQEEFERVMGFNPSHYRGARRPVENVTWWDAIRYANARSRREGLAPCYDESTGRSDRTRNGYRLPSEAEWQAAAADGDPKTAHLGIASTKDTQALLDLIREKGTREVGLGPPNRFGLYDMLGNVWEWTDDFYNPYADTVQQPVYGWERIIRGGSFLSTVSQWARGYRSSLDPNSRSRFTGFRMCRSLTQPPPVAQDDPTWFEPYDKPPAGLEQATGNLRPLPAARTPAEWAKAREALLVKWRRILGTLEQPPPRPEARLLETVREIQYTGKLMSLRTEADSWEKIFLMFPHHQAARPAPVVIVPYYDVDTPAGRNLAGRRYSPGWVRSFAYLAVQRGMIAAAVRWFGESYGEGYDEAVANLKLRHPGATGLGKWVWDSARLLDYLATVPEADPKRIGIVGHSLGAKMALYAAAMDERIKAVVFSEGGIGFRFSNYDDYWYLGERLRALEAGTDQHELLALIAPRPFLLIGGDQYDGAESWRYINAARPIYALFEAPRHIGFFNHHSGHSPTPDAAWHAMRWLEKFLAPADPSR